MRKIIVKFVMVLYVVTLVFLFRNEIKNIFIDEYSIDVVNIDELPSNSMVYVSIDELRKHGKIGKKIYFEGWAFCETSENNENKSIYLIFKPETSIEAYRAKTKMKNRIDVYDAFKEDKNVFNGYDGFECVVNTSKIADGKYKLYVEVFENNANFGVVETQIELVCKHGVLRQL